MERKIDVGREYKRQTSSRLVRECFNLEGTRTEEKSIFFLMEERRIVREPNLCDFRRPNFSFFVSFSSASFLPNLTCMEIGSFFMRAFFLLWCDLGYWHTLSIWL